jgi:hypothetical protein
MDILGAMPLEKLDGMTIQSELRKLAEVKWLAIKVKKLNIKN